MLIAFGLVLLSLLPLLQPHWTIARVERELQNDFVGERVLRSAYIHLLQQLYLNAIPWEQIASKQEVRFQEPFASELQQLGFEGYWSMQQKARKGEKIAQYSYAATIRLEPISGGEDRVALYRIFITRDRSEQLGET